MFLADRFVLGICPFCKEEDASGDQCDKCGKLLNPSELIKQQCFICKKSPIVKKTMHCFLDLPKLSGFVEKWFEEQKVKGNWSDNAIKIT